MARGASQELTGEDLVKHEKFLKAKEDLPELRMLRKSRMCEEALSQLSTKQSAPAKACMS